MGVCEYVNFVNIPPAPVVCLVTKIKNSRENHGDSHFQNKTNYTRSTSVHKVHKLSAVKVVEMPESYVKNGQNAKNHSKNCELYEYSLTYRVCGGILLRSKKEDGTSAAVRILDSVNFVNTAIFEVHKIQLLNIGGKSWMDW
jgi:hypothetical protein